MNSHTEQPSTPEPEEAKQFVEKIIDEMVAHPKPGESIFEGCQRFRKKLAARQKTAATAVPPPVPRNGEILRSALMWLIESNVETGRVAERQAIWRSTAPAAPTPQQRESSADFLLRRLTRSLAANSDPGIEQLLEGFSLLPLQILKQSESVHKRLLQALEQTTHSPSQAKQPIPEIHS